jgi:hypothetical protein
MNECVCERETETEKDRKGDRYGAQNGNELGVKMEEEGCVDLDAHSSERCRLHARRAHLVNRCTALVGVYRQLEDAVHVGGI